MDNLSKGLIPTKEEITEILKQVSQAQIENPNPMNLPVAILQAWVGCIEQKALAQVGGVYNETASQFKDEVIKTAEQFGSEVDKAINQYKDALDKAIQRFEGRANQ